MGGKPEEVDDLHLLWIDQSWINQTRPGAVTGQLIHKSCMCTEKGSKASREEKKRIISNLLSTIRISIT